MKIPSALKSLTALISLGVLCPAAQAANISLTANDANSATATSFNGAGTWSNATAPGSANDYFTSTFYIRTPNNSADYTFAGHSLTLQAYASANARSFLFKGAGYRTYVINNFTNASGGMLNSGSGYADTCVITGNVMVVSGNSSIDANQSPFAIYSPLMGSATLTNLNGGSHNYGVVYGGNNSAFTGSFWVAPGLTVTFNTPGGGLGNPAALNPLQFLLNAGSTIADSAGISLGSHGGITLAGSATITSSAAGSNTVVAGPITDNGSGYVLTKTGNGTLTLSGSNYVSGGYVFNGGVLAVGTYGLGVASSFLYSNGVVLWINGSQADFSAVNPSFYTTAVLDVGANHVGFANSFGGGTTASLVKFGSGTLILSNSAVYYGSTIVSNGVLALNGSGSIASCTNILLTTNGTLDVSGVSGGYQLASSQVLTGNGTVTGLLLDGYGSIIAPGGAGHPGTLTFGSLTLGSAGYSFINLDITNSPAVGGGTNDLLMVNGDLTLNGGTTVNVNFLTGTPGPGVYTIIKYTGTLTGDPATQLVAPSLGSRYAVTFSASSGSILMTIVGSPQPLVWTGVNSSAWDTTTMNWSNTVSHAADYFSLGDSVTFDDTGANSAVSLSTIFSPGAVTVSNSAVSYTFSGGGLAGPMSLTKNGNGTLILDETNAYTGATVINGGTVQVGNYDSGVGASLGTGLVTNNGSLVFANEDTTTLPVTYGVGTISSVAGKLSAAGTNYYTGNTYINNSYGLLANSAGFGATNGAIIVGNGGQVYMVANVDVGPKPLILAGNGPDGNGALRKGSAGPTTFYGPVTLADDTTLYVDGGATLILTNVGGITVSNVNNNLTNANLTLAGTGTGNIVGPLALGVGNLTVSGSVWKVAPTNNYSGQTTISGGTLQLSGPGSLGIVPATLNSSAVILNGGALSAATNVTLADGKLGLTVNANSYLTTASGITLTISNPITGGSTLTKSGAGTVVLSGPNSFTGYLYVDTFINYASGSDGKLVIANTAALAGLSASLGTPSIFQNNNTAASSTLGIDGTAGSVTIAPDLFIRGRGVAVANIENLAGDNIVSGGITFSTGGSVYFQSDSGTLTFVQPLPYIGDSVIGSARSVYFMGAGTIALPGGVQNANGFAVNLTKGGSGTLILTGTNSSTGTTVVTNGLLMGTGLVLGAVTVQSPGSIEAGTSNAIGTLTISSSLTLAGNTLVKLNKSTGTSDLFAGLTSVTYGGALTVTNLAGTLALGNSFTLFSATTSSGTFTNIIGSPGAGLAYSFTNGVLSVVSGLASNPTNLIFSVSGSTLVLSWPADHLGWILQMQTNGLGTGLATNWVDVTGSATMTSTNIAISPATPTAFFRLRHP